MNVLITGGTGYLGSKLTQSLRERAHRVHVFVGDVTSRDSWLHNVAHAMPDVVVHLAALTSLRECEKDYDRALNINYGGAFIGAKLCNNQSRFVLASTPTVAGVTISAQPMSETPRSHCFPDNNYDISKFEAEGSVVEYGGTVFRVCNVYGASIADSKKDRGIVNQFVRKGLRGEPIQIYESVEDCMRDYIFIDDALKAFIRFVENKRFPTGIYNVCSGEGHTVLEMAKLCGETQIIPDPEEPLMPIELRSWVGDYGKLRSVSEWRPRVSLEEGIELTKKALK